MNKRLCTVLLFLFANIFSQNIFAETPCEKQLSQVANPPSEVQLSENPLIQDKIINQLSQVSMLIELYSKKLGPYRDPFMLAWNPEQGSRIFQRLSIRQINGKWTSSPLAIINHQLKKFYLGAHSYNEKLIQWIIDDANFSLQKKDVDRVELQSQYLTLKYSTDYLGRYKESDLALDEVGQQSKEQKQFVQADSQQRKQELPEQDVKPKYPKLAKEYKPFTNDTQTSSAGGKQKKTRLAEVNFNTPYFAQIYFSNIVRGTKFPFKEAILPITQTHPQKYKSTQSKMTIRTFGESQVDLFIPPGFKPLQASDPRVLISKTETGSYSLKLKENLPEVHIPLIEDNNIVMMPHLEDIYTRPVGFKIEEWPEGIQTEVLRKFSKQEALTNPLQVAQAIADHLAKEYLYSVGPRPETDPIDALKAGAFQCDMAAYVMIGILRDVYQIPSRIGEGFKAQNYKGGTDGKSYLIIPNDAHVWVEVYSDNKWYLFEPTPRKKDKSDDKDSEDTEYSDINLMSTQEPESEKNKPDSSELESQSQSGDQVKPDHQDRLDKNTQKRVADLNKKEKKGKKAKESDPEEQMTLEDLANQLELGSLELEPKLNRNPLLERAMRVLFKSVLDPTQPGIDIQNKLNQLSSQVKKFNSPSFKQIFQQAMSAHNEMHPELKNWLVGLVRELREQDVNKSYQMLHRIISALLSYSNVLDNNDKIPVPQKLIYNLKLAQQLIGELVHPDAQDIGLVKEFVSSLPTVPRQLLKQIYDLDQVGPNSPTLHIAQLLKNAKLNDLRLLSILSPLSEFILNSTPRPEYLDIKTWQKDPLRPKGNDLLPLQRFSDISRALLGQPGKSIEENIKEGTAFVQGRRQRIQIAAGYGKEESERITIVLYDTSKSMNGDAGRFQSALISAFTGRALSDVTKNGRHRHLVVIVPFDSEPGAPITVTNTSDALNIIDNYKNKLKNTGGGTDIQKALLQGMSLIADAEKRSGEPLAAANIILMTDGQSEINSSELIIARNAINRKTPLQTMFIAINQTNDELMKFANDSKSMGSEKGFYREFTAEHIKDFLYEADHLNLKGQNNFYTDKSADKIPQKVYDLLHEAIGLADEFSEYIYVGNQYTSAREHLDNLEKLVWRDVQQIDRPLERWILKVRQQRIHPLFQDKRISQRIVDDLITNFEQLTGVQLQDLSNFEQEQLRHLIREAAGVENRQ